MPITSRFVRVALAALAALSLGACRDQPAAPVDGPVRLSVNAQVAAAGAALQVTITWLSFENESRTEHTLLDRAFPLGATQGTLPVSFSLTPCLANDAREQPPLSEGPTDVCVLHTTLVLLDASGTAIDRQSVPALEATRGATVSTPEITLGLRTAFTQFVSSAYRGCGLVASGNIYCAGYNGTGELGTGTIGGASSTLQRVQGGPWTTLIASSVSTGCALKTGGVAFCWGDNSYGQLGVPAASAPCPAGGNGGSCSPTPVAVSGGLTFTQLAAGYSTTCGIATGGRVWCWGTNTLGGQLGGGPRQPVGTTFPAPQAVGGQLLFTRLAVGTNHSCAIATDAHAYCWGYNANGELGLAPDTAKSCLKSLTTAPPSYDCRDVPTAVSGTQTFTSVGVGNGFSCALATDGGAWCWGYNGGGYLGLGTADGTVHPTPTAVVGGLKFTQLSVGPDATCGVTSAGRLYCWGAVTFRGQTDASVPQPIDDPHTFVAVTVGSVDACAIDTRGGVFCGGFNSYGEFGNGTTEPALAPVSVGLPPGVTPLRAPAGPVTLSR